MSTEDIDPGGVTARPTNTVRLMTVHGRTVPVTCSEMGVTPTSTCASPCLRLGSILLVVVCSCLVNLSQVQWHLFSPAEECSVLMRMWGVERAALPPRVLFSARSLTVVWA